MKTMKTMKTMSRAKMDCLRQWRDKKQPQKRTKNP